MFLVEWIPVALDGAMELWMAADDRNAVTDAIEAIDRQLARDPLGAGESRPDDQRIMFALPLGVRYRVIEADRLGRVVAVWRVRRPDRPPP